MQMKPADKDGLFIFAVVIDDPNLPPWELRQSFIGLYERAATLAVDRLGQMAQTGRLAGGARIELYSGAGALAYLAEAGRQELNYQNERRGQANN